MERIAQRYPDERKELKKALEALSGAEAKAQLAVTFMEPSLLTRKEAREYLQKSIDKGVKLQVADKEAIVTLEVEPLKIEHDLKKFDCDTSDKEYSKLESLLIHSQAIMKFTGATEKMR